MNLMNPNIKIFLVIKSHLIYDQLVKFYVTTNNDDDVIPKRP